MNYGYQGGGRGRGAVLPAWMINNNQSGGSVPGREPPPYQRGDVGRGYPDSRPREMDRSFRGGERRRSPPRRRERSPRRGYGSRPPPRRRRSRSPVKFRRSRSRSISPSTLEKRRNRRKNRKSNFDVAPEGFEQVPEHVQRQLIEQLTTPQPGGFGGGLPMGGAQQTRHARRMYVGGISDTDEEALKVFFNKALKKGLHIAPDGPDPVLSVYVNLEKRFAFVELHSVDLCTACMALDGIPYYGVPLKIRRPNDYNPSIAPPPREPVRLDLAAMGMSGGMVDFDGGEGMGMGSSKIFVGGVPYDLGEEDVRKLFEPFGAIKALHLVKELGTEKSRGFGFVEYVDPSVSDIACQGLNDLPIGDRTLTVRMAQQAQAAGLIASADVDVVKATRVLVLLNMVTDEDLDNDEEYNDIVEDVKEECSSYGTVCSLIVPRDGPGKGKIFVEFAEVAEAEKAAEELSGRKFAERIVCTEYLEEDKYRMKDFSSGEAAPFQAPSSMDFSVPPSMQR